VADAQLAQHRGQAVALRVERRVGQRVLSQGSGDAAGDVPRIAADDVADEEFHVLQHGRRRYVGQGLMGSRPGSKRAAGLEISVPEELA
jgi:hypothetical protein